MKWLDKLLGPWKELPRQRSINGAVSASINDLAKTLRDRTDLSMDLCYHGPSTVVLTGRYKNNDYVELHQLPQADFDWLVEELKERARYAKLNHVDCYPAFKASFIRNI